MALERKMRWKMRVFVRVVLIFYGFLQAGNAQNNSCSVTVHANHTAYNIMKMPNVTGLEHCQYSWANATNHVLAHNSEKLPEVIRKSVDTLVISVCINHTILSLDCFQQGRFIFHCLGDCPEHAALQEDKGTPTETFNPWIPVIVVVVILVLVLVLLCFLFYRYRNDVFRICDRVRTYLPVKMYSVEKNQENV